MAMSEESMQAALVNAGLAEPGQTSAEYAEAAGVASAAAGDELERPAESASKAEWQDYVEALGGDPGDLTIAQLKEEADGLGG